MWAGHEGVSPAGGSHEGTPHPSGTAGGMSVSSGQEWETQAWIGPHRAV